MAIIMSGSRDFGQYSRSSIRTSEPWTMTSRRVRRACGLIDMESIIQSIHPSVHLAVVVAQSFVVPSWDYAACGGSWKAAHFRRFSGTRP